MATAATERGFSHASDLATAAAHAWSNDRLELILFPTEQCNFRCTYCYEDFAIGRMRPGVVAGVRELVADRAPSLRSLRILWFGGEPLAAYDIVLSLSAHFAALQRLHRFGYSAEVTTNGYLLGPARLRELTELGVDSYQISLDGPQPLHDLTRRRANGAGSFERIWNNLIAARDSDLPFRILLRLHLTPANRSAMPEFAAMLRDELLRDPRFSTLLMPVSRLGGAGDCEMAVLPAREAAQLIEELQAVLHSGRQPDSVPDCRESHIDVCYAAKPNSLIVRADGALGKCTVALSSESNRLGHINADGSLQVRDERLRPWLTGWTSGNAAHLTCPLHTVAALAS